MFSRSSAILSVALLLMGTTAAHAAPSLPGNEIRFTVDHEGVDRGVIAYIPSGYRDGSPIPLVFAFHGGSGSGAKAYRQYGVPQQAERNGFIAVFPNGLPKPGGRPRSYYWGDPVNVGYVDHLIDILSDRYTIDATRIYAVGFSGGAKLCYELAAEPRVAGRIAAIGTVAGEIGSRTTEDEPWDVIDPSATGAEPLSAFMVQGAVDEKQPIGGGWSAEKGEFVVSFADKLEVWADQLDADFEEPYEISKAPARVAVRRWTNPETGLAVVGVVDPDLAHKWPRWDAMGAMWDFFATVPTR